MMDQMATPESAAAPQPMAPAPGEDLGVQQATPEEQEQYDMIVGSAFNMVYDEKMLSQITTVLEGGGDPKAGLARAASLVLTKVLKSAKQSGQEFDGGVIFHAGTEIFEDLAELSKEAGIHDFTQDPDELEGAYFLALDQLRVDMQEAGMLNTEAAKADFAQLQEMDANGKLEQMLLSLASEDEKGSGPEKAMPEEEAPGNGGGLLRGGM
jgi:hypothetical protein